MKMAMRGTKRRRPGKAAKGDPMRKLDSAIENKQKLVDRLRKAASELSQAETDLAALQRAKHILNGKPETMAAVAGITTSTLSVADAVTTVLSSGAELHIDDIVKRIQALGKKTSKAVVTGIILRCVKQGKRFKRTKPNTFAKAV